MIKNLTIEVIKRHKNYIVRINNKEVLAKNNVEAKNYIRNAYMAYLDEIK